MTKPALVNLKNLPYGGAACISDPDKLHLISSPQPVLEWITDNNINAQFVDTYVNWIKSTQKNTWHGLEDFACAVQTNGTTEAFDKFYMANHQRRFRCFRGEYMYHQAMWRNNWPDWKFLEDEDIDSNDAVIISLPFADTGSPHPDMQRVLEKCDEIGVPVLLDLCYFGVCSDISFDLRHDCITALTFSLSKTFPLGHVRVGLRLSRTDDDDGCFIYNKTNYTNRVAAGLGIKFMEHWGPDHAVENFRSAQLDFCRQLAVQPSHTVLFALGGDDWKDYNRGGPTNRISFHKYLAHGRLPI